MKFEARKTLYSFALTVPVWSGPDPCRCAWLGDYLHELAAFPNGRHDDQVDSTSQALNWFRERRLGNGLMEFLKERAEQVRDRPRRRDPDRPWRNSCAFSDEW